MTAHAPEPEPVADAMDVEAFRANAHRLVDWMADHLAGLGGRDPWSTVGPGDLRAALPADAPEVAESFDAVLRDLDDLIVPGITLWQHPRWFAYFPGNTSPPAILGEMAAATLAPQGMLWKTSPAVTELESHVLDWLADLLGLPATFRVDSGVGGGVIQASASDATHTALVAARHRARGRGARLDDIVAYTSSQAHSSVEKGANVAGYGHVRLIDVDDDFAQRPDALRAAIEADLAAGLVPAFVCSALGSTGTGAVDPVAEIGALAREFDLWHHVDAAWAGSYMICPELRGAQAGLDTVDSYVANPHKMMFAGMDCTAFWVADRAPLIDAMSITPPYLRARDGDAADVVDYRDWHVALGRRFRALKLWFVLRMFGADGIRDRFRAHLAMAADLADRIAAHEHLDLFVPASFGLVCVVHPAGADATRHLIAEVERATDLAVTPSEVDGVPYLRLSIGTATTTAADVDRLWEVLSAAADSTLRL